MSICSPPVQFQCFSFEIVCFFFLSFVDETLWYCVTVRKIRFQFHRRTGDTNDKDTKNIISGCPLSAFGAKYFHFHWLLIVKYTRCCHLSSIWNQIDLHQCLFYRDRDRERETILCSAWAFFIILYTHWEHKICFFLSNCFTHKKVSIICIMAIMLCIFWGHTWKSPLPNFSVTFTIKLRRKNNKYSPSNRHSNSTKFIYKAEKMGRFPGSIIRLMVIENKIKPQIHPKWALTSEIQFE